MKVVIPTRSEGSLTRISYQSVVRYGSTLICLCYSRFDLCFRDPSLRVGMTTSTFAAIENIS